MHNASLKYFRYVLFKYLNISTDFQMKRSFNGMMNWYKSKKSYILYLHLWQ
jgi:hypothetical protein